MPRRSNAHNDIDVGVGQRLRALRIAAGASQEDMAKVLGLSFQQVQKYEMGTNRLSSAVILILCDHFKVSPSALLGSKQDGEIETRINTRTRVLLLDTLDALANPHFERALLVMLRQLWRRR